MQRILFISDEDEKRMREERLKKLMLAEATSKERSSRKEEEDTRKLRKIAERELEKAESRDDGCGFFKVCLKKK